MDGNLAEVAAWLLRVARAAGLVAYPDIGLDNLNLVMQSRRCCGNFPLGIVLLFSIS